MKDKKSFLIYCDLIHTIEQMPDDKAGLLFKHILRYTNDLDPQTDDLIVNLTFEPIRQQLKRDLAKWKSEKENKSIAGIKGNLKRWNKDLYDLVEAGKMTIENALIIAESRKVSHSDNLQSQKVAEIAVNDTVNVTVNDTVNVNDINNKIAKATPPAVKYNFKNELIKNGVNEKLASEFMQVRKLKKLASTETAFTALKREIEKSQKEFSHIIKICVENSWGGFKNSWLENKTENKKETFKISDIRI